MEGTARRRQDRFWPTGVGGKGNEGVAGYVKQIPNSIGYVEYAYVVQNGMTYARAERRRPVRQPERRDFQAAAASADWASAQDFNLVMTNASARTPIRSPRPPSS